MGHPPILIRRCGSAQRDAAIATLAEALADDPQLRWEFEGPSYDADLRAMLADDVDEALAADELWAAGELDAVAAWSGPRTGAERRALVEDSLAEPDELGDPAKRETAASYDRALAAALPDESAWYLEALGTRRAMQRRGYATALLGPALARCDCDGVLAALETTTASAIAFYESLGFEVTDKIAVGDCPPGWLLMRRPRD